MKISNNYINTIVKYPTSLVFCVLLFSNYGNIGNSSLTEN